MNISVSEKPDILMSLCQQNCPVCGNLNDYNLLFYVHDRSWPSFMADALEKDFSNVLCKKCQSSLKITYPLIFDSERLQLLIFIVHDGDSPEIENHFKSLLGEACHYLPDDLVQSIKKKPYTFVDGWKGFKALLNYFQDVDLPDKPPLVGKDLYVFRLDGYIYGKLFFYYPDEHILGLVAIGFLGAADNHRVHDHPERAYEVLLRAIKILGDTHQWLTQELGILALRIGRIGEAKIWLGKAVELQHKWLAPTISFRDATPRKRAEGEAQDSTLPHVIPATARGDVTASKHVVSGVAPPRSDYGLWYFPELIASVTPQEYLSVDKLMIAYAIALGELEYSSSLYEGEAVSREVASLNGWAGVSCGLAIPLLYTTIRRIYNWYIKDNIVVIGKQFWIEYVLRRGQIPYDLMDIAAYADSQSRIDVAKKLGNAVGQIERVIKALQAKDENPVEELFLKNALEALDDFQEFFLKNALETLDDLAKAFTRNCPNKERRELTLIRLQAEFDVISEDVKWTVTDFSGEW